MKKSLIATALFLFVSLPALAAPQTVTLSVPGMTCSACPITVKAALNRVEGVTSVDVRYEERDATVTFDDEKTTVEALTQATTNAGYPSTLKQSQAKQE
ncbi:MULTISPECIES: mercury resistance system periplasmic binding protein MerP [Gammaproteobacteria]|jgi:mercuric ion binding protein|nr:MULTISPECIES: mercury resistance system periplasmic binding protein MerP [Gammaproteobacteria]KXS54812.1 MAG: periplasmic mercuric ion binding protein [Marinobacter sp. T13-3]KZZ12244.1 mercuric transport protein periplasmic component [Oleibacter sp. HI0075]MAO26192.1 mercuric transport protein periplasmic component [Roseovarius sp.]MBL4610709.1 mercury resistance system periplasmic binding protein MerP [Pseudomonas sp.]MEC7432675.1 mercury resistance system periplasmic binding protein MerP|tara:strand:+ start:31000 stop:31296 length:297 start_codon:yes stop_codon:yes gene_type:complete